MKKNKNNTVIRYRFKTYSVDDPRPLIEIWGDEMEMLRLTRASDGSLVLVNPLQIKAVYGYFRKDTTIVDYSGEYGYIEVKESVEAIWKMLKEIDIWCYKNVIIKFCPENGNYLK